MCKGPGVRTGLAGLRTAEAGGSEVELWRERLADGLLWGFVGIWGFIPSSYGWRIEAADGPLVAGRSGADSTSWWLELEHKGTQEDYPVVVVSLGSWLNGRASDRCRRRGEG